MIPHNGMNSINVIFLLLQKPVTRNVARNTWCQTQLRDSISTKYKYHNAVKPSLTLREILICLFWWMAWALINSSTFSRFTTDDDYKWQKSSSCDFLQPHVIQIHIFFSAAISPYNKVRRDATSEISGLHRRPHRWEGQVSPEKLLTNNQPTKPNIPEERRPGNDSFLYFVFVFK